MFVIFQKIFFALYLLIVAIGQKLYQISYHVLAIYILQKKLFAFIVYVLLYAFILAPYCLIGYISELINCKKEW